MDWNIKDYYSYSIKQRFGSYKLLDGPNPEDFDQSTRKFVYQLQWKFDWKYQMLLIAIPVKILPELLEVSS